MIGLERRPAPSRFWLIAAPLFALAVTLAFGWGLFHVLGKDPVAGLKLFLVAPLETPHRRAEVGLRMTPLLLCALGLAICYRANVWNIGAEGQLVAGGLCAGVVALQAGPATPAGFFVLVLAAGAAGGAAWGGITAWLKVSFQASEILVSLMLTYIAQLLLLWAVHGPLKDPAGYNFPYSPGFEAAAILPLLWPPHRLTIGWVLALGLALAVWVLLARSRAGLKLEVVGASAPAARYAGFPVATTTWLVLGLGGALAGLAGAIEVAGPIQQLTPSLSPGYGYAAIVVAWFGRLHPVGCVVAAGAMAMIYIGGELAQSRLGLPLSITLVFQGVLLLALLGFDTLVRFRLRPVARRRVQAAAWPEGSAIQPGRTPVGEGGEVGWRP